MALDIIVSEGYKAIGYEYVIIDDCWLKKNRSHDRKLQPYKKTDLLNNSLEAGTSEKISKFQGFPDHENLMKLMNFLRKTLSKEKENRLPIS